MFLLCFFFKQKTAYEIRIRDWSSDVCSSDLLWPNATRPFPTSARNSGSSASLSTAMSVPTGNSGITVSARLLPKRDDDDGSPDQTYPSGRRRRCRPVQPLQRLFPVAG